MLDWYAMGVDRLVEFGERITLYEASRNQTSEELSIQNHGGQEELSQFTKKTRLSNGRPPNRSLIDCVSCV